MKYKFIELLAIILVIEIGMLHLLTAQAEYEEAAYMGYLFAANFFGALAAAFGIYHRQAWGWILGLVIAAGSMVGYAWSRTLGMPGMNVEEWFTPYGVAATVIEGIYLLIFLFSPWKKSTHKLALLPGNYKILASLAGLVLIGSMSFLINRWDISSTPMYGFHVGTLEQVINTPVMSSTDLENEYGIQVSLVAVSMMNSIVDVRIKIIEPVKAQSLLMNQAALLVGQQALILAPHMHSHNSTRLKAGKVFMAFFPTEQIIRPDSQVSLVFGRIRVEPTLVK